MNSNLIIKLRKRKGFSLVELLIVIIIIGILAGSLLLVAGGVQDKAMATRIISDARVMKSAAMMYHSDQNSWPLWAQTGAGYQNMAPGPLPSKYVDQIPVRNEYWFGVMASGDVQAAVVLKDNGLSSGVKERMARIAEDDGIYALENLSVMDFSDIHVYSASDNNMIWFITGDKE